MEFFSKVKKQSAIEENLIVTTVLMSMVTMIIKVDGMQNDDSLKIYSRFSLLHS